MPSITLPDGSVRGFDEPVSGAELAASIGPGLATAALAGDIDGERRDRSPRTPDDAAVRIIT